MSTNGHHAVYAAHIESDGLRLSIEPRITTETLRAALIAAGDPANHGDDGAAIVRPDGSLIYSAAEYSAAWVELSDNPSI